MALNVPAAVLFGVLTFMLNFIPTIGSVVAVALPVPVLAGHASLVTLGPLWPPGAVQFAVGQIWENKLLGDRFDLRASVVLLGWCSGHIWGIVGMILATPITAVLKTLMLGSELTGPWRRSWGSPLAARRSLISDRGGGRCDPPRGRVLVARRARLGRARGEGEFPAASWSPARRGARRWSERSSRSWTCAWRWAGRWGRRIEFLRGRGADLRLTAYAACPVEIGSEPRLADGTHDDLRWVTAQELITLELAPLDAPRGGAIAFLAAPDDHLR